MEIEITGESIAKWVKRVWCLSRIPLATVTVFGVLVLGFIAYGQSREIATLNERLNVDSESVMQLEQRLNERLNVDSESIMQLEQRLKLHVEAINSNSYAINTYHFQRHPPLTD